MQAINASDSALLAEALHQEIKKITDQPVCYLVLENGQRQAMLGTDYWQRQGATLIAHANAAIEIEERGEGSLKRMKRRNREKAMGRRLTLPGQHRTITYGRCLILP